MEKKKKCFINANRQKKSVQPIENGRLAGDVTNADVTAAAADVTTAAAAGGGGRHLAGHKVGVELCLRDEKVEFALLSLGLE